MLREYIKLSKISLIKIIREKNELVAKISQDRENLKAKIEELNEWKLKCYGIHPVNQAKRSSAA